ncbi:MAG: zinc transporter, family [Actinomycetota bacterium]|jgi:ZIP family zinc transporter|nr:zinc transporter, family [Actinomycetota bacterium]
MSHGAILVLGAIAGMTIFIGLPMGRVRNPAPGLRAFLNAIAIGILIFLLWDVLSHAIEPVEAALVAASVEHTGSWARFAGLATTFVLCLGVGMLSLVYYDSWNGRRHRRLGPGAAHVDELARPTAAKLASASGASRLALFIALGIGLHNFSEGLAIGQSAAKGEVSLALMLIIGFALHNATEGFGIVAPLAGEPERPSWRYLALLGVIGGGPTFVGTLIGQSFVNETVFLGFLALAAGSILYVVIQLLGVAHKLGYKKLLMWGVLVGLLVGFATDFILVAAGA